MRQLSTCSRGLPFAPLAFRGLSIHQHQNLISYPEKSRLRQTPSDIEYRQRGPGTILQQYFAEHKECFDQSHRAKDMSPYPLSVALIFWEGENSKSCRLLAAGALVLLLLLHPTSSCQTRRFQGFWGTTPTTMDFRCRGLGDLPGHCGSGYAVVQLISQSSQALVG